MTTVLLIIQLMISIVLIGLILIQKSEGGALGIGGGGGGGGGLMSGRSSASAVVKATTILGTLFIINCLLLSIFFALENPTTTLNIGDKEEEGLITLDESSNDVIPLVDDSLATSETEIPATETDTTPTEEPQ